MNELNHEILMFPGDRSQLDIGAELQRTQSTSLSSAVFRLRCTHRHGPRGIGTDEGGRLFSLTNIPVVQRPFITDSTAASQILGFEP
jgi:hypothetical protein